eukprot:gene36352-44845_t
MSTPQETSLPAQLARLDALLARQALAEAYQLAEQLAVAGTLPIVQLFTTAAAETEAGRAPRAVALFRCWLEHTESPAAYAVLYNMAVTLSNQGDDTAAEDAYRRAILLNPRFIEAHMNLGTLLQCHGLRFGQCQPHSQCAGGFVGLRGFVDMRGGHVKGDVQAREQLAPVGRRCGN